MRYLKYFALLGVLLFAVAGSAHAQVAVGVRVGPVAAAVGPEPVCAYGYYSYYPYACAPYGYYAPSWFLGGVFVGAGPWYHYHWYGPRYYGHSGYWHGYGYRPGYGYRAPVHAYVGHPGPVYRGGYHGGFRR
jgi:hypothetical protein